MAELKVYGDLIGYVGKKGYLFLSDINKGFPSLSSLTEKKAWHKGDPDTDPWCWKDRSCKDKLLAYGSILGGHKGFISPDMYKYFYSVFTPHESYDERWEAGVLKNTTWDLYNLFEKYNPLNTSDIRKMLGMRVDSDISTLMKEFYITVSGSMQKINRSGEPYGWTICIYEKVENWAPKGWIEQIPKNEAIGHILNKCKDINKVLKLKC